MRVLKKYLGLFIFYCFADTLSSQSVFNVAFHDKSEQATPSLQYIANNYYFSTYLVNGGGYGTPYLYRYSESGLLKSRSFLNVGIITSNSIKTLDNKLMLVGRESFCDVFFSDMKNYICKIDTNGVILFSNFTTDTQWDNYKNVLQHTDSTYYVFTDSVMCRYSKSGQLLLRKNTGLSQISSVLQLPNNNLILSAKQSNTNGFYELNASANIINSIPTATTYIKMSYYNGNQIMAIGSDGKHYKFSPNFTLIGNSLYQAGINVADFVLQNDSLYSISSSSTIQTYFITDTSFQSIHSSTTSTQKVTQINLVKNQSLIGVLSSCVSKTSLSWPGEHMSVTLNVFPKNSGNMFSNDIEIISVELDSAYAYLIAPGYPPMATYTSYMRAKVGVKNKSNLPLTTFKLNAYIGPDVACGAYFYQQDYNISSLAMNDTVYVMTGFIHKMFLNSIYPSSTVLANYCLFTTVPNGENDNVFLDNELCTNFIIPVAVSIKENEFEHISVSIYPNPFNSKLTIGCNELVRSIVITDQLGRTLSSKLVGSKNIEIELGEIESGIYFLKIETEKGFAIKKVIKN